MRCYPIEKSKYVGFLAQKRLNKYGLLPLFPLTKEHFLSISSLHLFQNPYFFSPCPGAQLSLLAATISFLDSKADVLEVFLMFVSNISARWRIDDQNHLGDTLSKYIFLDPILGQLNRDRFGDPDHCLLYDE